MFSASTGWVSASLSDGTNYHALNLTPEKTSWPKLTARVIEPSICSILKDLPHIDSRCTIQQAFSSPVPFSSCILAVNSLLWLNIAGALYIVSPTSLCKGSPTWFKHLDTSSYRSFSVVGRNPKNSSVTHIRLESNPRMKFDSWGMSNVSAFSSTARECVMKYFPLATRWSFRLVESYCVLSATVFLVRLTVEKHFLFSSHMVSQTFSMRWFTISPSVKGPA